MLLQSFNVPEGAAPMDIRVIIGDIASQHADAVVVNLFEGVSSPGGATGAVDGMLGGAITQLIADGDIKGKLGEFTMIHSFGKLPSKRVVVAGLGKATEFNQDKVRRVAAETARYLRSHGCQRAATIVHGAGIGGLDPSLAAQALAEGTLMGLYTFRRHKAKKKEDDPEMHELLVVELEARKAKALDLGIRRGTILAEATNLCRDLANESSNNMTPTDLAAQAQGVADRHGLDIQVLDRAEMKSLGMGALLAVAQGSAEPPKFIVLRYRAAGAPEGKAALGLLGKGVTFDSGGISIKSATNMDHMKGDMAGGAAVIAAMGAIAQFRPAINVVGVVPAAENLPSATAYKPGDIVRAMNGKTIEVLNTDAEGRMLLADALSWGRKEGLSPMVDVATLTGACAVALGPFHSGVMGNNQPLIDKVLQAGKSSGEPFWQLPLTEEYKELVRSDVADVRQTGTGNGGGAITAAQMLAEFAEDTPWAHLDIAPTARTDRERGATVKGHTGVAVRTLVHLTLALAEE
ncbi:MAG: leucyl aminopeptidase [Dehalococcoidia bacterium]|nr:leucyl aminopeptidase [Dehalococcoidia bacterium]